MFGFEKKLKLSVIIPVFNTKDYLIECLESVKKATENIPSEIITVDSGSDDGSLEILRKYESEHKNFRLFQADGAAPGEARNTGIAHAKGKYIAFVDSDDFVAEDIYENMIKVAERDGCDMVLCNVIRWDGKKYTQAELLRKAYHNIRNQNVSIEKDRDLIFDGTVGNRLIRTSFYRKSGISFPEGMLYEDVPVITKLNCMSKKTALLRKWGYCWRIRKGSISQQQFNRANVADRITALRQMKKMAAELKPFDGYSELLDYKILALEFNGCISILNDIPAETAAEYTEMIASFIEENVDLSVTDRLSVYDRQKVRCILDRDVDGLIRLLNYKKINYMNAPVTETEDGFQLELPEHIFTVAGRSFSNEMSNMPYWMSIDSAETEGSVMTIHTHVYIRRINMQDPDSQDVRVFLVNDISGAETELKAEKEPRPALTKARGTVFNYDDYRDYHYNYDGTGFSFSIDINDFADRKDFQGWNFVLLEVSNKVGKKNQVLRFGTKQSLDVINSTTLYTDRSQAEFSTDETQVFGVTVTKRDS